MAKQPKIRFKGFTEEWKEKTFSELYYRAIEKNDLSFGPDKIISVANMFYRPDASGVSTDEYMRTYNIMRVGDIAYEGNKSANFANGRWVENYIGDGIISHVFEVLRPKTKYDLMYWRYAINNEYIMRRKLMLSTKKATMMTNIVVPDFLKQTVFVPTIPEQERIGGFLTHIDNTISRRAAELEKLRSIKSALLEKLFPQDGQYTPAIRFKGFEGKWENRRLKDIATRVTRKNIGLESTLPLCISAQLGLVSQTEYYNNVVVGANLANYFLIKKGEFAYNKSAAGEYPMGAVKCLKSLDKGILSTLYIVFALKDDIDADYVQAHYETKPWQDDVKKRVAVGARNHGLLNISPEDFFDSLVVIPHNNDEQKKVGQILAKLSQTISLRERQLTLLKHSKQALLEQMFVNE